MDRRLSVLQSVGSPGVGMTELLNLTRYKIYRVVKMAEE